MERVFSTEAHISFILTTSIGVGIIAHTEKIEIAENYFEQNVNGFLFLTSQNIFNLLIFFSLLIIFLLTWIISKIIFSTIYVRNKLYEIDYISDSLIQDGYGAFGRWEKQKVILKDTKRNKTKLIYFYPSVIKNFQEGDQVFLLKRKRTHTYEMDKFYLIPKEQFDLKRERLNYIFNKETPRLSNISRNV